MNNKPIKEVYEKYKHLDRFLADETFIFTPIDNIRYDMWQAIRTAMQVNLSKEKEKPDETVL